MTPSTVTPPGPLGWIAPADRTPAQATAHALAMARMPRFSLAPVITTGIGGVGPVKILLTDYWKDPEVVADCGQEFTGFHQITGSCVGASAGNAIFTLGAIQRKLSLNPTKAFIPWWPFSYGRTRTNEGDVGQGEGAVDSIMGQTLMREGVLNCTEAGLPAYNTSDGFAISSSQEMQWSDGSTSLVTKWLATAKVHTLGVQAPLYTSQDIKSSVLNGYPVLDGNDYYVGHGQIKGTGGDSYVRGKFDGRGGHSTCILGYWDHPNDGPLYLYSNQWPSNTYPSDPAGGGRCTVWLPESEVDNMFRTGSGNGETMSLSHLNWFPAQSDRILDFTQI